tara:strand:+ start:94 stop:531 length:438 start_codon:yes stop_codon:yes gene_type:complete
MLHFKIILITSIVFLSSFTYSSNYSTLIKIKSNNEEIYFNVEIANTENQRIKGLMNRDDIENNEGMLFIFPSEHRVNMWMKDTYIPLDIIFISKNKYIVDIIKNTKPESKTILQSKFIAKYVLEIKAGLVELLNINIGDMVSFEK